MSLRSAAEGGSESWKKPKPKWVDVSVKYTPVLPQDLLLRKFETDEGSTEQKTRLQCSMQLSLCKGYAR